MTCEELGVHQIVWGDIPLCCQAFPRVYGVAEDSSNEGWENRGLTAKRAEDAANTLGPAPTRLDRAEHQ